MPKRNTNRRPPEDLGFYQLQSDITAPGRYDALYGELPTEIHELCEVVQNLLLHQFWIIDEGNYGLSAATLQEAGRDLNAEINLRSVQDILGCLLQMDDRPLTAARDPKRRVVGNCRDYSVLLVSMLRHQGVPARVRSGVARYFFPSEGHLEDHFICEFWNHADRRWQQADAQIDAVQRRVLNLAMDLADLPPDQFLNAGQSYFELEQGRVAPEKIGIFEWIGERYVNGKLVSDLACVNSVEVLPWEGWGICKEIDDDSLSADDRSLLEEIAGILTTLDGRPDQFQRARELFQTHPRLKLPHDYQPYFFKLPAFG